MRVLGLDLSLKGTGMCILDGDGSAEPRVRTELIPQPEAKTVEQKVLRLEAIAERIVNLIRAEKPDHVCIEAPAKGQVWQAAAIGEVHGVVKVQVHLESGQFAMVREASEMRKAVVGKISGVFVDYVDKKGKKKRRVSYGEIVGAYGKKKRATIKDVIEATLKDRGLTFPTQDEMDAYVAARYCWGKVVVPGTGGLDDSKKT